MNNNLHIDCVVGVKEPLLPLELVELLGQKVLEKKKDGVLSIALAGGSCCGKSFYAPLLMSYLKEERVAHLKQDEFQLGYNFPKRDESLYRWDDPENFDPEYAAQALETLSNGKDCEVPQFDLPENIRVGYETLTAKEFLLFEGLYTLHEQFLNKIDFGIYFEVPFYARFLRRIFRFTREVKKDGAPRALEFMINRVYPAHELFVRPQKESADIVVTLNYSFQDETQSRYQPEPISAQLEKRDGYVELPQDLQIRFGKTKRDIPIVEILWKSQVILSIETTQDILTNLINIDWLRS